MEQKISQLKPGRHVVISSVNGVSVVAERTRDGQFVRIVRETKNGFEIVRTFRF